MSDGGLASHNAASARDRDLYLKYGPPREVYDDERRAESDESLRKFLENYFPDAFYLGWSADHLQVIEIMQRVASTSGLFALAMPRGSGKTTIAVRAALWALLTRRRQYVEVLASTEKAARKIIKTMRTTLTNNQQLCLDYPSELYGIPQLKGDNRKAGGQLCRGEKTNVVLGVDEIVFPTHEFSPIGGSVVYAAGLTGSVRGPNHTRIDGSVLRPDFVILDDPQTRSSATHPAQTENRAEIVDGDVLGLAGPGKTISAVMPCTVIAKGDLADRYLNNPRWEAVRAKMLYSFPTDMKWWDQYFEERAEEKRVHGTHDGANARYQAEQAIADAGAVAGWLERKKPDEISAIQSAMHLWYQAPEAFAAEYQNEPLEETLSADAPTFAGLETKLTGLASGVVPVWATRLTCAIDVQKRLLFWVVVAWSDDFTGSIIDYGTFPEQGRNYFTYSEAGVTLQSKSGSSQLEAAVRWGLDLLTQDLFGRAWKREGGGEAHIDKALVDANYGDSTDAVYEFCRRTPYSGVILPSHGRGIKAGDKPMNQYNKHPGETHGFHWYSTPGDGRRAIKHVIADVNFWKTFLAARAKALIGERGSMSVYGKSQERHRMLLDHLQAESPVQTFGRGRELWEWKARPGADNHWLDCLVLAGIAASMSGCALDNLMPAAPDKPKRVSFSQMQKARRG